MPLFDEKHVKICGCYVVWDGITRPDKNPDGSPKYSLKVVVDPNNPDIGLYHQLSARALQESKWQGVLPAGARMPVGQARADEFNGLFNGWAVLNCNSQRIPDIRDEQTGALLDPMQYGPLLYGGQKVDVLVHCYEYDKAGNKGIATGIDAFSIIVSANAPRQQFGNAGIDTSGAFSGGAGQPMQQQPMQQQPMQQQPMQQQPMQQQPMQQQPMQQQPMQQQPMQQQPVRYDPNTGQPIPSGQPQQAHNFLPNQ